MMRFLGIEESNQKLNFRSCAGAELTQFWEKEVRVWFEATEEEGIQVAAHTYRSCPPQSLVLEIYHDDVLSF